MTLLTDDDVAAIRSKYQCGGGCDGDSCDRYYAPPMPDDIARLLEDRAALLHERDALRAEMDDAREELQHVLRDWNEIKQAIGSLTNGGAIGHANALRAERDALAKDAARYRWLRGECAGLWQEWMIAYYLSRGGENMDAAIDAEMTEREK